MRDFYLGEDLGGLESNELLLPTAHFRWRSCISRPTRLMTWGEMFSNDERSDIFLLLMAGARTLPSPAGPTHQRALTLLLQPR